MKKWLWCSFFLSFLYGEERIDERMGTFKDQHFHYVIEGNNHLAFNLLKIFNEEPGNFCFSPFTITSGLAKIFIGAKQETSVEMQKVLNFTSGFAPLVGTLDQFFLQSKDPKKSVQLFPASQVWMQEDIRLMPAYSFALKRDFEAKVEAVDFQRSFVNSIKTINNWAARQTGSLITQVVFNQELKDNSQIVVTTAFAMKGAWRQPFERSNTKKESFQIDEKRTRQVEMMHIHDSFLFFSNDLLEMVEIPFQSNEPNHAKISMILAQPKEMKNFIKELNKESWESWEAGLRLNQVDVGMPRFRLDDRTPLDPILRSLGLKEAFTANANFSAITEQEEVKLSHVAHRAMLKIDESGSHSSFSAQRKKILPQEPEKEVKMTLNHPFFIFIIDRATGCLLCVGRIIQP